MFPTVSQLDGFTNVFDDEVVEEDLSQPLSFPTTCDTLTESLTNGIATNSAKTSRPLKHTGQHGDFRSVEEIDPKYRCLFTYPYFNLVQSRIIEDALYTDKSMVLCAPTGSGKTVVFELAILQLLMQMEDAKYTGDFKVIYMAPVKAVCNERLMEWYPKLTKLGLLCLEVTGDTEVDFAQLKPYKVIITTPEKWDILTRRWRDHRGLVEMIKLFLIDEVHILNDETRGPVLEAVVSRMKTVESAAQSAHRIEQLQKQYQGESSTNSAPPRIRFVAVSATVSNPEDVADWLGTSEKPAVFHKFGDECRPVKLQRIVEGYPCAEGTNAFKFDLILNYKLWPIIQKYYNGKPTLIFCNTRKSVTLTAEALSREVTVTFSPEQKAKLTALASTFKNKKLQMLVMSGVGCHHAGLLYEERLNIERAFRNRDLPILITTTTLAMGVNLPAHLVIVKNTQQYVNGAYQEYSISTVLQMVGRAGRPQFDTEATAVIMTRLRDKPRYQALVGGCEPLQSYLHKRIAENLNSEAALRTVTDVAQCVEWLRSTFLYVRAAKDPKRYLGLQPAAPMQLILKKIEELCVKAMNSLASSGLITMDEASCIESTEAGRLMSLFYLDVETMKNIMKIQGTETLERLLWLVCESHELADMHLRMDERRCLNLLNRNNAAATIRFPMKGKINTRQMKLNCIIQATLGCIPIPEPSLNQEAMKVMKTASRVCKCLVKYVSGPELVSQQPQCFLAVLNSIILSKCIEAHLWENSPYVSKQLKGIGPTFSTLLATAGVTSFMLLEESHPRDLERIMNKGPPAGNIIRKQVSLLPKYQLTITPLDSRSISVQLMLLNHAHLSENMNHLTAGDSHRSYLIVGDSENNLLLLTQFTDKDLISVYDGIMKYEITRKLSSEHKILIHCMSSTIVGIDAHADYFFLDLEPQTERDLVSISSLPRKNDTEKQTTITDVYREKKRKNNCDTDITECKEKKKRENALTQKLKSLKESFGKTSKALKRDVDTSAAKSNKLINDLLDGRNIHCSLGNSKVIKNVSVECPPVDLTEDSTRLVRPLDEIIISDDDDYIDDSQIDSILNKIESEISGNDSLGSNNIHDIVAPKKRIILQAEKLEFKYNIDNMPNLGNKSTSRFVTNSMKHKRMNMKTNFSVIDLIEKKANTDDVDNICKKNTDNGFSDTIKSQINKFLQHTQIKAKLASSDINELLQTSVNEELPKVYLKSALRSETNTCAEVHDQYNINSIQPGNNIVQCKVIVNPEGMMNRKCEQTNLNNENYGSFENLDLPEVRVKSLPTLEPNKFQENDSKINTDFSKSDSETVKYNKMEIRDFLHDNNNIEECNRYKEKYDLENGGIFTTAKQNSKPGVNSITEYKNTIHKLDPATNMNNVLALKPLEAYTWNKSASIKSSENIRSSKQTCKKTLMPYHYKTQSDHNNVNQNDTSTYFYKSLTPCLSDSHSMQHLYDEDDMMIVDKMVIPHQYNYQNVSKNIGNYKTSNANWVSPAQTATNSKHLTSNGNLISNISQFDNLSCNVPSVNRNECLSSTKDFVEEETHTDNDHQNEAHFKRYSYTATKVDVCTKKYAPDHELRITRKLKVDVDITEIVKQDNIKRNKQYPNKTNDGITNTQNNDIKELCADARQLSFDDNKQNVMDITKKKDIREINAYNHTENDTETKIPTVDINETPVHSLPINSVGNILQKYSKILIKPETNNTQIPSKINNNIGGNSINVTKTIELKSSIPKSRKPFRIGEINTMNLPLPDTLTNTSQSALNTTSTNPVPAGKIVKNEIRPQVFVLKKIQSPSKTCDDATSYESPPITAPTLQLDPMEDIKDENMFNPKLLLQYFSEGSKEADIIAPPAPFRDEPVYSPATSPAKTTFYEDLISDVQYPNDNIEIMGDQFNDHIALDSSSNLRLSPNEIETWCLSRDDECDTYTSQPIPSNTWLISQRMVNSQVNPSLVSRRGNLCQFKFVRKKPLKH